MDFPIAVGIHVLFDPGLGNGSNVHTNHELIVGADCIVSVLADGAGAAGNNHLDALLPGLDQAVLQGGDFTGQDDQHLSTQQDKVLNLRTLGCGRIVRRNDLHIVALRLKHFDQRFLLQYGNGAGFVLHADADDLGAFPIRLSASAAAGKAADHQQRSQHQTYKLFHYIFLLMLYTISKTSVSTFFFILQEYTIILTLQRIPFFSICLFKYFV